MPRHNLIEVELGAVSSKRWLQETLARALGFPGLDGSNWDGFWDAITGLVKMPISLRVTSWSKFAVQLPAEAQTLHDILAEMAMRYPDLASEVIYA